MIINICTLNLYIMNANLLIMCINEGLRQTKNDPTEVSTVNYCYNCVILTL